MTASAWTDDRIDRLKTLWLEGRTAEQIAADLKNGITRSAVLGKVYRMGLSAGRPARPPVRSPKPTRRTPTPAARCGKAPASPAALRRATTPVAMPARSIPDPEAGGLDLLSLRPCHCRWPYGDPRTGVVFCGRPVARGAYCAAHAEVGYRPAPGGLKGVLALARTA